jgi:predicted metal-dependent HD superfamily phosphohydrolase
MLDFRQRWMQDWARLGLAGSDAWRERLLAGYAEPGRHYHTLQHLAECLDLFDRVAHLAAHPGEAAIALWFHDAVYLPQAKDNEARSADWACTALREAGAGEDVCERVRALIMATAHHAAPSDEDARLVVDIDLAILGADTARFAEYEEQVRAEYAAVPAELFRQKRAGLLARFLKRSAIYNTTELRLGLEEQARSNLRRTIEATRGRISADSER